MKNVTLAGNMPKRKALSRLKLSRKINVELISSILILLFVYTALSKFVDFGRFKHFLEASPLIGQKYLLVAYTLPSIELIVSALLFIPRTRLKGLYASAALMTVFTIYLGYMIAFVPKLPCNCGGVISQMTWKQHLVFNIFFTLLAYTGIWLNRKKQNQSNRTEPSSQIVFT